MSDARVGQLPLPFTPRPDYAMLPLIAHAGLDQAQTWLGRTDWQRLALWGDAGTGKTHLLHHWAAAHAATIIAGQELTWPAPAGPLAIDEGDGAPVMALLHTLNAAAEAGAPVLLTAREPPGRWPVHLPDLHSRLSATFSVQLLAPDDGFRARLFRRLLDDRQLHVSASVQAWLLTRLPRNPAVLREAAARLDYAALAAQRAPNRAMAAAALAPLLDDTSMADLSDASPAGTEPG